VTSFAYNLKVTLLSGSISGEIILATALRAAGAAGAAAGRAGSCAIKVEAERKIVTNVTNVVPKFLFILLIIKFYFQEFPADYADLHR
jgi:hypothetical protein